MTLDMSAPSAEFSPTKHPLQNIGCDPFTFTDRMVAEGFMQTLIHTSDGIALPPGADRYRQTSRDAIGVDIRSLKQSTLKSLAPKKEPPNMITSFHILRGDDLRRLASKEKVEAGKPYVPPIKALMRNDGDRSRWTNPKQNFAHTWTRTTNQQMRLDASVDKAAMFNGPSCRYVEADRATYDPRDDGKKQFLKAVGHTNRKDANATLRAYVMRDQADLTVPFTDPKPFMRDDDSLASDDEGAGGGGALTHRSTASAPASNADTKEARLARLMRSHTHDERTKVQLKKKRRQERLIARRKVKPQFVAVVTRARGHQALDKKRFKNLERLEHEARVAAARPRTPPIQRRAVALQPETDRLEAREEKKRLKKGAHTRRAVGAPLSPGTRARLQQTVGGGRTPTRPKGAAAGHGGGGGSAGGGGRGGANRANKSFMKTFVAKQQQQHRHTFGSGGRSFGGHGGNLILHPGREQRSLVYHDLRGEGHGAEEAIDLAMQSTGRFKGIGGRAPAC